MRGFQQLHTISDVVALLKSKEARREGVEAGVFQREGLLSVDAVAVELRSRGYEIEVSSSGGDRRVRLLSTPGVGARRRKRDQLSLVPRLPPPKPRGPYEEERELYIKRGIGWPGR